jgi:hypothetical protein
MMPEMRRSPAWAAVVSGVFNPLLAPTFGFLLLFSLPAYFALLLPMRVRLMMLSVVFINTALLPLISMIMLKRIGLISSITLEVRGERLYPLLLGAILTYLTYFLLHRMSLPGVYSTFLFGTTLVALLLLIITWKYPISIHLAALGGISGMLLGLQLRGMAPAIDWLALSILVSGMMGTARMLQNAHNALQVVLGWLLGFAVMTACFLYF